MVDSRTPGPDPFKTVLIKDGESSKCNVTDLIGQFIGRVEVYSEFF